MAEEFDPYHKWLGIPANEQPPNHYRLLGLELYECDPEVIDCAADQRMSHLKTYQTGKNAHASQNLLTEVAKARVCLLDSSEKTDYDQTLRLELALQSSESSTPPPINDAQTPFLNANPDSSNAESIRVGDTDSLVTEYKRIKSRNKKIFFAIVTLSCCLIGVFGYAYYRSTQTQRETSLDVEKSGKNKTGATTSNDKNGDKRTEDDRLDPAPKATDKKQNSNSQSKKSGDSKVTPKDKQKQNKSSQPVDSKNDALPNTGSDTGNPTIVIAKKTNNTNSKTSLKRTPVPSESVWKPFVNVLRREFEIEDDLKDQQRFTLFNELLTSAKTESHPGRSFAMFQLAMEQASMTGNTNGRLIFNWDINQRFVYEDAEKDYLVAIANNLRNKLEMIVWLEAANALVKKKLNESDWASTIQILQKIIEAADGPLGRTIDANFFKSWLKAIEQLAKISSQFDSELGKKWATGQLSDNQQIDAGIYFYFVKREVSRGLSHFAKSKFKPLIDLAEMAKKPPANPNERLQIAEKWLMVSSRVGDAEFLFREQAKEIYNRYKETVPERQHSKKTTKRIEELNLIIGGTENSPPRSMARLKFSSQIRPTDLNANILGEIRVNSISENSVLISGKDGYQLFETESGRSLDSNYSRQKTFYPIQTFKGSDQTSLLANLEPRRGLRIIDVDLRLRKKSKSPFQRVLPDPTMRAFDVGDDFTVYALTLNDIKRWSPDVAWRNNSPGKAETLPIATSFIPNRIEAIPDNGYALSDNRNLARISTSQKAIELFSGTALYDYDFSQTGAAVILATKGSINFRLLKGKLKRTITTQPDASRIKFIDGARFAISLHVDGSIRAWDVNEKSENYQLDSLQLVGYKPIDFSISIDKRAIILVDEKASLRKIKLFYE